MGIAADKYKIPKTTLFRKIKNEVPLESRKGPSPILRHDEEEDIVKWIVYCADRGYPIIKDTLFNSVQKYLVAEKRKNPFKNNRPGWHWYKAFLRRHPNLSLRIAQNLTSSRASVTDEDLKNYLKEKNLLDISPDRFLILTKVRF